MPIGSSRCGMMVARCSTLGDDFPLIFALFCLFQYTRWTDRSPLQLPLVWIKMGAKHSKGTIRSELQGVLPRSWAELELFHTRFQQEVFHRKAGDAQCQFFLTFPVFRSVVLLRTMPTPAQSDGEEWRDEEQLLRIFQYLDRNNRHRIAAMDFFAGLALVTNAKKAAKFDFLFSLLDNGGLKVLNGCEVMMIVAAAARGLAMFKAIPAVDGESLRPLARRLMGESAEVTRAQLVEKALTDPEIVFFMNDLENEAATTSDALLAQQGRLMKSIAANELQLHRIEGAGRTTANPNRPTTKPASIVPKASRSHRPSVEAMLRRLQAMLLPPARQSIVAGNADVPRVIQNVSKRLDWRSLCRLVQSISEGTLYLTKHETEAMLSSVNTDELGSVRSSDILRVMRVWLTHASIVSPPLWQTLATAAQTQMRNLEVKWLKAMTTLSEKPIARSVESQLKEMMSTHQHGVASELTYTFKAHIAQVVPTSQPTQPKPSPTTSEKLNQPTNESAVRVRLRVHHIDPEMPADDETDEPESNSDEDMALVLELGLRSGLTDEDAIDFASAVEQFLNDEAVSSHIQFALTTCQATVVESQVGSSSLHEDGSRRRCLRLTFPFKSNVFEDFEHVTRCQLSKLVRSGFFALDFDQSLKGVVEAARRVVSLFPHLMKQEERETILAEIFLQFDLDKDGKWSLQEFNAFQQAISRCVLDDPALFQCFGGKRELVVADLIKTFQTCSADEFRALIEKLGRGSLASQLRGVFTGTIVVDEHELKQLEQSLSPLHWGDHTLKRLCFFVRSIADMSCDFHCRNVVELMQAVGAPTSWCAFAESPTKFVQWLDKLQDLVSPTHKEHERDFTCRSLLCSMEEVVSKRPQQLELEDQQQGLPQGTSVRRAATILKAQKAMTLFRENASSLERLAITSHQICISGEVDNFNLVELLRTHPKTAS